MSSKNKYGAYYFTREIHIATDESVINQESRQELDETTDTTLISVQ